MNDGCLPSDPDVPSQEVRRILDAFLVRRAEGAAESTLDLLAAHSAHASQLSAELEKLTIIDRARELSRSGSFLPADEQSTGCETLALVRCPHCETRVELEDGEALTVVHCESCGQSFQILAEDADDLPASIRGRFELLDKLGNGSFGDVWRALDLKLDREVALKIPRRRTGSETVIDDALREARVAARLRHRHIVTVHEVDWKGSVPYIVSDLIRGETLDAWASRRSPTFRDAANLCRVVAEALEHAHNAGVIHRDLKPANILIDQQGEPHLTDFGLAKQVGDEPTVTADGRMLGTPAYMSPEQARGLAHQCDRRSDVYSLGVVLFQLLTGDVPFRGNLSVLPTKVIHADPPSPRQLNRYVPRDLETICLKCLEKEPARRYPTALALAEELGRFGRDEPIVARPLGWVGRLWRWRRRQPAVAAWAAVALGLLAVVVGLSTWGFLRERTLRREIEATAHSQRNLLSFVRRSDAVQKHWKNVEQAATAPELTAALAAALEDARFQALCDALNDAQSPDDSIAGRERVVGHEARRALQAWVEERYASSDPRTVFAWFVQDASGLQIARAPADEANVGRNYAWRTYFHGGERDYGSLEEWRGAGSLVIGQPHLSADFRTEITDQEVVAVSAPIRRTGRVVGVVGVFLYVVPPQ